MKITLMLSGAGILAMAACGPMSVSFADSDINPMKAPGAGRRMAPFGNAPSVASVEHASAGRFVQTIATNTAFFRVMPKDMLIADLLLPRHTSMRLIEEVDQYSKVELDSGDVGFVLSTMLQPFSGPVTNLDPVGAPPLDGLAPASGRSEPMMDLEMVPLPPNDSDRKASGRR